jgi:hypothetical protein
MRDCEGEEIKQGDLIQHNYGIPPTNVNLFVFRQNNCLMVVDADGNMTELTDGIANSSYLCKETRSETIEECAKVASKRCFCQDSDYLPPGCCEACLIEQDIRSLAKEAEK